MAEDGQEVTNGVVGVDGSLARRVDDGNESPCVIIDIAEVSGLGVLHYRRNRRIVPNRREARKQKEQREEET